jgi:hypothetical protein
MRVVVVKVPPPLVRQRVFETLEEAVEAFSRSAVVVYLALRASLVRNLRLQTSGCSSIQLLRVEGQAQRMQVVVEEGPHPAELEERPQARCS